MKFKLLLVSLLIGFFISLKSQDTIKNRQDGQYYFKKIADNDVLDVQNQNRTSTCWSFSSLSFLESELIRMGKGKHNLSEMFVVRHAYIGKAETYVRMNGFHNFGPGGAFHDLIWVIKKHGLVPEEVYGGLNYGSNKHQHDEMDAVLKAMVEAIKDNHQGKLTTAWKNAFGGAIDAYLGKAPEKFTYKGKEYTPKSFAQSLNINVDDYVSITSFTHHPIYSQFVLEVPDNWAMERSYNVSLNDLNNIAQHALKNGYTLAWGADVSEKGFSFKNGVGIVPVHDSLLKQVGKDSKGFNNAGAERFGSAFDKPMPEKVITDSLRQAAFDNYETTDDHGMHIVGMYQDQNGNLYYKTKNSWGTDNYCGGYLYVSETYFKYKTINIMLHKSALPKEIAKKLGIN